MKPDLSTVKFVVALLDEIGSIGVGEEFAPGEFCYRSIRKWADRFNYSLCFERTGPFE